MQEVYSNGLTELKKKNHTFHCIVIVQRFSSHQSHSNVIQFYSKEGRNEGKKGGRKEDRKGVRERRKGRGREGREEGRGRNKGGRKEGKDSRSFQS